jgi:flagellar basal-body rod protein FlgC
MFFSSLHKRVLFISFILLLTILGLITDIYALGADDALRISQSGVEAQKVRLKIVAENIANASTLDTDTGLPYQKKYVVLTNTPDGVAVADIKKSSAPFQKVYDPGNPMADLNGFIRLPNVIISEEMVNLSYTNLLYEANVTAYKSAKAVYQQSLEIIK